MNFNNMNFNNILLDKFTTKYISTIPPQRTEYTMAQSLAQNIDFVTSNKKRFVNISGNNGVPKLNSKKTLPWEECLQNNFDTKYEDILLNCHDYSPKFKDPSLDSEIKQLELELENMNTNINLIRYMKDTLEYQNNTTISAFDVSKKKQILDPFQNHNLIKSYNELLDKNIFPSLDKIYNLSKDLKK